MLDEVGEREVGLVPECAGELATHLLVAPRGLAVPALADHHGDEVALGVEVERVEIREALERAGRRRSLAGLQMRLGQRAQDIRRQVRQPAALVERPLGVPLSREELVAIELRGVCQVRLGLGAAPAVAIRRAAAASRSNSSASTTMLSMLSSYAFGRARMKREGACFCRSGSRRSRSACTH